MGQYYLIANIDRKEFIDPHAFDDGAKLCEFGPSGTGTMFGLAILLADGNGEGAGDLLSDNSVVGSWAGDRIVITGDYAEDEKFVPDYYHGNLYQFIEDDDSSYQDISYLVKKAINDDTPGTF